MCSVRRTGTTGSRPVGTSLDELPKETLLANSTLRGLAPPLDFEPPVVGLGGPVLRLVHLVLAELLHVVLNGGHEAADLPDQHGPEADRAEFCERGNGCEGGLSLLDGHGGVRSVVMKLPTVEEILANKPDPDKVGGKAATAYYLKVKKAYPRSRASNDAERRLVSEIHYAAAPEFLKERMGGIL